MMFDLNTKPLRLWFVASALGLGAMTFSGRVDARGLVASTVVGAVSTAAWVDTTEAWVDSTAAWWIPWRYGWFPRRHG